MRVALILYFIDLKLQGTADRHSLKDEIETHFV